MTLNYESIRYGLALYFESTRVHSLWLVFCILRIEKYNCCCFKCPCCHSGKCFLLWFYISSIWIEHSSSVAMLSSLLNALQAFDRQKVEVRSLVSNVKFYLANFYHIKGRLWLLNGYVSEYRRSNCSRLIFLLSKPWPWIIQHSKYFAIQAALKTNASVGHHIWAWWQDELAASGCAFASSCSDHRNRT